MTRSWETVLTEHIGVVGDMSAQAPLINEIVQTLITAFREKRTLFLAGNGGSAADAQHIAAEFVGRFKQNRRALPAIALTTDTSALTAIGNDLGFENVFSRQLEGLAVPGDLLWVLSTSGTSPNIVQAVRAARERGLKIIGFTGESGGAIAEACDWLLRVPHRSSDRIQEAHLIAYHFVCEQVEAAFA